MDTKVTSDNNAEQGFRVENGVPRPLTRNELETLKERYLESSKKKAKAEKNGDKKSARATSRLFKQLELKLILAILKDQHIANKVDEEIEELRDTDEAKSYKAFLRNAASQAFLIHVLTYDYKLGGSILLPSPERKLKEKFDFLLEIDGTTIPVVCRSRNTVGITCYSRANNLPKLFENVKRVQNPPVNEELLEKCRVNTGQEPLVIAVPYNIMSTFMKRKWEPK
ncbi:hypothetical protein IT418_00340 [bacterium]|nr:hypothetical protein [bacterium]